jgi:hypothetical protein
VILQMMIAGVAFAQQPQNPSPMVEHTRAHTRLTQAEPAGNRERLALGTLFVPRKIAKKKTAPLLVFFHGGTWVPEVAAAKNGKTAVISIQIGSGSGVYARQFEGNGKFEELLAEAEQKSGMKFKPVTIGGWSAGNGALREILKSAVSYERVQRVLMIDGIHASYLNGTPGPLESEVVPDNLQVFLKLARDAMAGRKQAIITYSEIFPGTYASTTETADYLVAQLGLRRKAILRWGPMGSQQLSEVKQGRFRMAGYAGNSAPDHVDQLHSLPEYLKWFR